MITNITLAERRNKKVYLSKQPKLERLNDGNLIFQKYFYSVPPPVEPILQIFDFNSKAIEIKLRKQTFKSGEEGFSGIYGNDFFIVRANISKAEDKNYFRLTVIFEEEEKIVPLNNMEVTKHAIN